MAKSNPKVHSRLTPLSFPPHPLSFPPNPSVIPDIFYRESSNREPSTRSTIRGPSPTPSSSPPAPSVIPASPLCHSRHFLSGIQYSTPNQRHISTPIQNTIPQKSHNTLWIFKPKHPKRPQQLPGIRTTRTSVFPPFFNATICLTIIPFRMIKNLQISNNVKTFLNSS